ncbi:MAG: TRAP transporter small permease subunit [Betaproteobacteria bacterium]|nr:MAG: TRAP transporter small permease subunit [Betaproteobacteria bacterium]
MTQRLIYMIDQLSKTVGHAFAWCIVILTFGTCYEVFVRYVLDDPTSWAFDMSYMLYGAVFYMTGAYTLSRAGHVRADMFYRLWSDRTQAIVELVLYVLFFFPGILALVIAGWGYGTESLRLREVSVNSPAGVPIWPLKMMIPFGAGLIALQGFAEVLRCVLCLRDGRWVGRLHDVEELEKQIIEEAARRRAAEGTAS